MALLSPAPRAAPPVAQRPIAHAAAAGEELWQATRPSVTVSQPRAETDVPGGRVTISGVVDGGAQRVIISIRNRREHLLDQVSIPTRRGGAFGALITIPAPAESEDRRRVWLEVIAYDAGDIPVAGLVRPLSVVHPPRLIGLLGEDGGVGVLGVDLSAAR